MGCPSVSGHQPDSGGEDTGAPRPQDPQWGLLQPSSAAPERVLDLTFNSIIPLSLIPGPGPPPRGPAGSGGCTPSLWEGPDQAQGWTTQGIFHMSAERGTRSCSAQKVLARGLGEGSTPATHPSDL